MPELLPEDDDPVRSFTYAAAALDIDISTFRRRYLPEIPIEVITERRRGVRQSVIESLKRGRTRAPARTN
jgi:hypothetical protein